MEKILDGKKVAAETEDLLKNRVEALKSTKGYTPTLATILVGKDPASATYVKMKGNACERVGMNSLKVELPESTTTEELLNKIVELNNNSEISGILLQHPVPSQINERACFDAIDVNKDVDGVTCLGFGNMAMGEEAYGSCTPQGIVRLLDYYDIETSGKDCVIIGRSHIVGSPMSILMARNNKPGNCTVTLTHSKTRNLKEITRNADILIVALGKAEFVTADMVKDGVCIIDVGITRVASDITKTGWKLLGDVSFDEVKDRCSFITPVPGGVGPMTIAMLLRNTLKSAKK